MSLRGLDSPSRQEAVGTRRTLMRSFANLAVGEGVARVFGLVALIWMTRSLGPGGFGLVTLGATLVLWIGLVVDSGTETLGVRDISRAPREFRPIAEALLGLRLAISLVVAALYTAAVLVAARHGVDRIALARFALVLPAVGLNIRWMVLGVRGSRAVAIGNAAGQLVLMVGVIALVTRPHDTIRVPLIQAVGELLYAVIVLGWAARRVGVVWPRIDIEAWCRALRDSVPLLGFQLSRAVINFFDLLLIAIVLGRTSLGFYAAAYKPVFFLSVAIGLFYISFLASYSAAAAGQRADLFRHTVRLSLVVTVPIAIALSAGASVFIGFVFGHAYQPGTAALAVLAWTLPLGAIGGAYSQALIAGGQQRTLMWHAVAAAAFNVGGNLVAVPAGGIVAAAAVTLASQALITTLNYHSAVREGLAPGWRTRAITTPLAAVSPGAGDSPAAIDLHGIEG